MPRLVPPEYLQIVSEARSLLATYREAEDLIRIGAYKAGSDPALDRAIAVYEPLTRFLKQGVDEPCPDNPWEELAKILQHA